jgi:hypothetical protein
VRPTRPAVAGPSAPLPTAPAALAVVAPVRGLALLALRPGRQIDRVVVLAALLRTLRRGLALEHAHQANVSRATASDVERFHQARQAVALHLHRLAHRLCLGASAQVDRHWGLGGWRLGRAAFLRRRRSLGRAFARPFCDGRFVGGRRTLCFRVAGWRDGVCLARLRLLWHGRRRRRIRGPESPLHLSGPLQQDAGELGNCLHGVRPSSRPSLEGSFDSRMQRLS